MTQSLYEGFGGLDLPISDTSEQRTFQDLDPAQAVLSGLFRAAINAELGPRWAHVVHGTPLQGKNPVEDLLELPPTGPRLKERSTAFPLLCVNRDGTGVIDEHTLSIDKLTQPWAVDYVLGGLDIGPTRKLLAVFQAVVKIIERCIRRRGHPAYENGALQFFADKGHIGAIRMVRYDGPPFYQARFAGGDDETVYLAVSIALETVEYSRENPDAFGPVEGMTQQINAGGEEGIFPGLVYTDSTAIQSDETLTLIDDSAPAPVPTDFLGLDGNDFFSLDGDDFLEFGDA